MIGVLILAGGQGSRIGGNKALLNFRGRSLISYVIKTALELSEEIFIVVEKEEDIEDLGQLPSQVSVVSDIVPGKGPLIGIYSGLRCLRSEYSVILPCDSPFIRVSVVKYLVEKAQGFDAAIPIWPNGYVEPLHSVYKVKTALRASEEAIKEGKLRVQGMIERLNRIVYISTEDLKTFDQKLLSFFNINSEADLRVAEELHEAHKD